MKSIYKILYYIIEHKTDTLGKQKKKVTIIYINFTMYTKNIHNTKLL